MKISVCLPKLLSEKKQKWHILITCSGKFLSKVDLRLKTGRFRAARDVAVYSLKRSLLFRTVAVSRSFFFRCPWRLLLNTVRMTDVKLAVDTLHGEPSGCAWMTLDRLIMCPTGWSALRRVQSDLTELNWHSLVFDGVTHYSRCRLTASVTTWLRARTRQPLINGQAFLLSSRLSGMIAWTHFIPRLHDQAGSTSWLDELAIY